MGDMLMISHAYQRLFATVFRMRRLKIFLILAAVSCVLFFHTFPKGFPEWSFSSYSLASIPHVLNGILPNISTSTNSSTSSNHAITANLKINGSQKSAVSLLQPKLITSYPVNKNKSGTTPSGMVERSQKSTNEQNNARNVNKNVSSPLVSPINNAAVLPALDASLLSSPQPEMKNLTNLPREDPLEAMKKLTFNYKGRIVPLYSPETIYRIKSVPVAPSNSIVRVILVTYFRAGSSFLGDLLQQNWRTYFHFEPLHMMSDASRIKPEDYPRAAELLGNLFRCQMSKSPEYSTWVKKEKNRFLIKWNTFLWSFCRMQSALCFASNYMESICVRAPINVMKITRLTMQNVKQFLEDNPDLNLKVVYLVRDPRGIYNSRRFLSWCTPTKCSNITHLCKEMEDDFRVFQELQRSDPSRFILVRYEDVSVNPEQESKQLLEFLGIPYSSMVRRFLRTHTQSVRKADAGNPYSTRRNSTATPFKWRHKLPFSLVQKTQEICMPVMDSLGYKPVLKPDELSRESFIPITAKEAAPVKDLTTHKLET